MFCKDKYLVWEMWPEKWVLKTCLAKKLFEDGWCVSCTCKGGGIDILFSIHEDRNVYKWIYICVAECFSNALRH